MHLQGAGKSSLRELGTWNKEPVRDSSPTDAGSKRRKGPGTRRSVITDLLHAHQQVISHLWLGFPWVIKRNGAGIRNVGTLLSLKSHDLLKARGEMTASLTYSDKCPGIIPTTPQVLSPQCVSIPSDSHHRRKVFPLILRRPLLSPCLSPPPPSFFEEKSEPIVSTFS